MNKLQALLIFSPLLLLIGCGAPADKVDESIIEDGSQDYDELLAEELGADDYGMKQYVIAFLKSGPNQSMDSTRAANLQRAHLDNIKRLAEEGRLILAGPFIGSGELRGMYVFDVRTVEEARELTETDPAIEAGRLEMELYSWYGSAALMEVNNLHTRISKTNP